MAPRERQEVQRQTHEEGKWIILIDLCYGRLSHLGSLY